MCRHLRHIDSIAFAASPGLGNMDAAGSKLWSFLPTPAPGALGDHLDHVTKPQIVQSV
jgi:hypothetical protein